MAVHMDLGEFNLHMADEYQESSKECLFGVETNTGSLMQKAKISMDWGQKDMDSLQEDGLKCKLVVRVDVTGMGMNLTFKCVQSLLSTAMSFKALLKILSPSVKKPAQSRVGHSNRPSGKGTQLLKFNLERCSLNFCSDVGLEKCSC